jgi:hypothetical protein
MYYKHNGMSSIKLKTYARGYRVSEVHKVFKVKWKEFNLDDLRCLQACAKGESASL